MNQLFKTLTVLFLFTQFHLSAQVAGQQLRFYLGISVQPIYETLSSFEDSKISNIEVFSNNQSVSFAGLSYMKTKASGRYWDLGINLFPAIPGQSGEQGDSLYQWNILAKDKNRYYQAFFERGRSIGQHRKLTRNAYFGWFLRANAHFYEFDSQVENRFFDEEHSRIGLQFGVTARYQAKIGKRVNLEFSLPVMLMQVSYNSSYVHNPAFPRAVNQNSLLETGNGIGLAQVRVGIGFLLGKINSTPELTE